MEALRSGIRKQAQTLKAWTRRAKVQRHLGTPGAVPLLASSIQCPVAMTHAQLNSCYLRKTCLHVGKSPVINPSLILTNSYPAPTLKSHFHSLQRNLLNHQWGLCLSEAALIWHRLGSVNSNRKEAHSFWILTVCKSCHPHGFCLIIWSQCLAHSRDSEIFYCNFKPCLVLLGIAGIKF